MFRLVRFVKEFVVYVVLGIYAYVTLREGAEDKVTKIIEELRALIKKQIAAYAIPDHILVCVTTLM